MITLPMTSWAQEVSGSRADVVASDVVRACVSTHRMAWTVPPVLLVSIFFGGMARLSAPRRFGLG